MLYFAEKPKILWKLSTGNGNYYFIFCYSKQLAISLLFPYWSDLSTGTAPRCMQYTPADQGDNMSRNKQMI